MLRHVSDAYTIKRELWINAVFKLVGVVAYVLMQDGSEAFVVTISALTHLAVFQTLTWKVLASYGIRILTGTGTGILVPLRMTATRRPSRAKVRSAITLCDLLSHPGGVAAFEGVCFDIAPRTAHQLKPVTLF